MLRRLTMTILALMLVIAGTASAQTPGMTPATSPATTTSSWTITDSREIEVDGTPIALSPDGQWLAGLGDEDNQVCVWDVETLSPSCDRSDQPTQPFIGNGQLSWAPDSSAFAFTSSDLRRLVYGNVYVFDVDHGTATSLTNIHPENTRDAPLSIGVSWTPDSQDIVVTLLHGFGKDAPEPEIGRISREGGDIETVVLPDNWTGAENLLQAPFVDADGNLYVAIASEGDTAGIWQFEPDGSSPEQLLESNSDPVINRPMIVSGSPDGRYLNIVSMTELSVAEVEHTFFLLDTESGELTPLEHPDSVVFISFAPDNETGLMALNIDGTNRLHTMDLASSEISEIENSPEVDTWLQYLPTWASKDTVFLPADSMLLTLGRTG